MSEYRPWLPEAALDGCAADGLLAEAARQWSAKWFARRTMRPLGSIARLPSLAASEDDKWLVLDKDLAIGISAASRTILASMMLDVPIATDTMADADHRVVADLVVACLEDLSRRLAQIFRLAGDTRWSELDGTGLPAVREPRGCSLGVETNAPLVRFVVSTDLMIGLIKAGLPLPLEFDMVRPITEGLATQSVSVSALLGRCSLTLAELSELSEGDVLVFDRDAGSPLPLALGNSSKPVGRCSVERRNDLFHLTLLEPLSR